VEIQALSVRGLQSILEGEMVLRIHEDSAVRDIPIRAGDTFLLPPRLPHSPPVFERLYGSAERRTRKACA